MRPFVLIAAMMVASLPATINAEPVANGLYSNGITVNGVRINGLRYNALSVNGMSYNSMRPDLSSISPAPVRNNPLSVIAKQAITSTRQARKGQRN